MFRSILEHSISAISVSNGISWNGLESSPANRKDQRIFVLEQLVMPSVLFEAEIDESHLMLI
jgi:hypothetical protein